MVGWSIPGVVHPRANGTSLRSLLLTHGAVGFEAALVVLKDSLLALAACHERGLAHGDIKPEHVVLTSAGRVRLVDFGLWTSDGRRRLGRSTPFYLAPEQWSDHPTSTAGDVYAATVTFFECLVGAPPFYAKDVAELSAKHQRDAVPVGVLPEPIRQLVLGGLAKDPVSRSDARRMLAQVEDVATRAAGSGWERHGRRELAMLLGNRSALADVSGLGRRSGGGCWERHKPVRLAAVMGGALALAAGLASPPLAVIVPGASIFGFTGRSPVLAFPESDHDAAPVRVVTNGPLADRTFSPAAQAGTGGPIVRMRPPAPAIPASLHAARSAHPTPDALSQGSAQPNGVSASQSTSTQPVSDQSTSAAPECRAQLIDRKPYTAVDPEQSTLGSAAVTSDEASIPVSMPTQLPVQVPVPVQLPVPMQAPVQVPIEVPLSVPGKNSVQLHNDAPSTKATRVQANSQGWEGHDSGRWGQGSGHSEDAGR